MATAKQAAAAPAVGIVYFPPGFVAVSVVLCYNLLILPSVSRSTGLVRPHVLREGSFGI